MRVLKFVSNRMGKIVGKRENVGASCIFILTY